MNLFKDPIRKLLELNPTNIWTNTTFKSGLFRWDSKTGKHMKTHGPPTVFDDQAAKMLVLMGELANKKRSTTSGVRQPAFLRNLLSMIDPSEDDGKNDGSEEPLMEASPQRRSKQLVAWSPETAEKTAAPNKSGQQSAPQKM